MELKKAIKLGTTRLAELKFDGRFVPKLNVYNKPTNHNQHCWVCGKQLVKGEMIVREMSGISSNNHVDYCYAHIDCQLAVVIHTILGIDDEIGSEEEPSQ